MRVIVTTILAGILGFILSVIILIHPWKSESPFFEIKIENKKERVKVMLKKRIETLMKIEECLTGRINIIETVLNNPKNENSYDLKIIEQKAKKKLICRKLDSIDVKLVESRKELYELDLFSMDTAKAYYSNYFSVDQKSLFESLNSDNLLIESNTNYIFLLDSVKSKNSTKDKVEYDKKKKYITLNIVDTSLDFIEPNHPQVYGKVHLKKEILKNKVQFINKYPAFGFWFVLSIAQMCMWLVLASLIIFMSYNVSKLIPSSNLK